MRKILAAFAGLLLIIAVTGCQKSSTEAVELKHYPLDNMEGVITQSGVEIDKGISGDGKGSLKIVAIGQTVVSLFETGDLDVENARITYQAKVRTEGLEGQAFLEMWCGFTGKGEFFSRGLQRPLSGTMEWTTVEIPFFLQKGQNPDNIKLNLVVNGKGTVWIDDIKLIKGPLQ